MLARTPSEPDELDYFFRELQLPEKPATLATAEDVWRKASAALEEAKQRHIEAGRLLNEQRLGEAPKITRADVDEIGTELVPLMSAETEAKVQRDRVRQAYAEHVEQVLSEPLSRYRDVIAGKINELEDMLAIGALLNADCVSGRITLRSKLPSGVRYLIIPLQNMRAMLRKVAS